MAAKVQKTSLSGAFMLICVVTGILMLAVQWRKGIVIPKVELPKLQFFTPASPKPASSSAPQAPVAPISDSKVVVDLSDRQAYFYKKNKLQESYPIAIGKEGWETPKGSFKVFQMYRNPVWQHPITGEEIPPGNRNPLGKWWIGFGTQGKLVIGFHGTPEESLIGQAVSHGCVRMKNDDIASLYKKIQIGTPVIVRS